MRIFISWSLPRSRVVAHALREWLPNVVQSLEPWMSEKDIESGARWDAELSKELGAAEVGIICLTPENVREPWLMFESGALSKHLEKSRVCTYLVDLQPSQVTGPLASFQHTIANKNGTQKLLETINNSQENSIDLSRISGNFEKWWPDLDKQLRLPANPDRDSPAERSEQDMLRELVQATREIGRSIDTLLGRTDRLQQSPDNPIRLHGKLEGEEQVFYDLRATAKILGLSDVKLMKAVNNKTINYSRDANGKVGFSIGDLFSYLTSEGEPGSFSEKE